MPPPPLTIQAIAGMIAAPAALVTSGCAGAMVMAAAAAMTGGDPRKIIQLPDTTGMPREILIQSNQRYHYDRCWEMSGGKLVEYEPTEAALRAAITHRTAACVSRPAEAFPGSLPVKLIAQVALAPGSNKSFVHCPAYFLSESLCKIHRDA